MRSVDDLITLVALTYTQDDMGVQVPKEEETQVWAHLKSVTRNEWMDGGRIGLQPQLVAVTPSINYDGQLIAEVQGVRYTIYRTYCPDNSDEIELYLEERTGTT